MHKAFEQFQVGALHAPQSPEGVDNQQILQPVLQSIREPRVNLSEKFDGTWSRYWGFVNQIQCYNPLSSPTKINTNEQTIKIITIPQHSTQYIDKKYIL
jgi:hypothetical protein